MSDHTEGEPWDCPLCNPRGLSRDDWYETERAARKADVEALSAPRIDGAQ